MAADLLSDGNIKVTWAVAIANIAAPTVAELTAGTAVDLECLITLAGLDIKGDTASVDNTALCSTDDTEEPGRVSYNIEIEAKRKITSDLAWSTLVDRALGYLVVRRSTTAATAWAVGQPCEVYPVRCGRPVMEMPEKNSAQKFKVKLFNNSKCEPRATVA